MQLWILNWCQQSLLENLLTGRLLHGREQLYCLCLHPYKVSPLLHVRRIQSLLQGLKSVVHLL